MKEQFEKILLKYNSFSTFSDEERVAAKRELLDFATENKAFFTEQIKKIEPSEESILFEIYETLSLRPQEWVDFIVEEFERVQKATERASSNLKKSTSYPLIAIGFFTSQNYIGIDKLMTTIKNAAHFSDKEITLICLDLLGDLYTQDMLRFETCKLNLEGFKNSIDKDISKCAHSILQELNDKKDIKEEVPKGKVIMSELKDMMQGLKNFLKK